MVLDAERVQTEIEKDISDDPMIREAMRIEVVVKKTGILGFGKESVVLGGSVHSENDKKRAEQIASFHSGGRPIIDEIQVLQ
jgi:osmotically-inducible protein OsmY